MKLSVGIVGLPNVGKSTLFNALMKKQVANVANYPFCTIEPNIGVIEVPDKRLPVLAKVVNTQKIIPAAIEFYDIAGLVKGASKGEGLGNKFLSHIREVSVIVHVVRLFEDGDVIHVANKVDPKDDMETIENELLIADLETLNKQIEPKGNVSREETETFKIIKFIRERMNQGIPARNISLAHLDIHAPKHERTEMINHLNLLTLKPVIYVFNVSEKQLENPDETLKSIKNSLNQLKSAKTDSNYLYLNAKLETEVLTFSEEEQKEYLKQFNLEETGLNRLIKKAYETLGLISFLTAGEKEVRAWTIQKGNLAPEAAGVIHSDFEKHFIKANVIQFDDFVKYGGWHKAHELGKVQIVGKDHVMKEGEVVEFKVGV
ncbi:redox-regulated ATPase YchF [Candidatus Roizmanbacteria bacterium RIFCSPLOWO2_01_FULL_35_13]|uniref:Ribosome-binding ATPase YchF n=1 Tax=Candidatus Roizmanbacteria bacterium RIFCSPLOWO2_01_FULL_35_13 TaxID=1802055 RepID=A0A1F7I813_9BACT|nr:MAG: redox-regulated ATPase YchF [Candidatus Roizmanbacteria bacterium RIFCSPLOWO2_01_FULL_35_13]